jgi:fatty acid desaturase
MAEGDAARVEIDPDLLLELHRLGGGHRVRLLTFLVLYGASAYGAYRLADTYAGAPWLWAALAPLVLLAAASLHGVSLFVHEGVHGTLSANPHANRWLSILCALPVLQNYSGYRVLHLRHHLHLGREGDPDHYPNYTRWTWLEFLMHWGRLLVGYPVYIVAIPVLGFRHGTAADRRWICLEAALLGLAVVAVVLSPLPWPLLLCGWVLPMLVINTLVNVRGMSQHTLLASPDPVLGTRSILTNPVTAFFMCNENYHLEHHLFPGVPWYNLRRLHRALGPQLAARGAPYIPSYFAFVREFVVGSFRRSPLGRPAA